MKRTKAWWAALTKEQRSRLVFLELATGPVRSAYLPEDSRVCSCCGDPSMSSMCHSCLAEYQELIDMANKAVEKKEQE